MEAGDFIKKYFPNGAVNLKLAGGGDGKKQYEHEKKIMAQMLNEFASHKLTEYQQSQAE